ncbi:hypothetical protein CWRG_01712 [Chthonomonas calidirosea]|uniref:hypothetical protein n=1 Tax=Chthonomonas calidirosea TaxID=454171 RepID=UPI0006DD4017|nr:hypothetical protein [Chthonomonas calidirosea]CEK17072.1 hypothetical protein CWRG_01712 [Chthonomonas calidirosea]
MKPIDLPRQHPLPMRHHIRKALGFPQGNLLLLLLHGPACAYCQTIEAQLQERRAIREAWGTQLAVLYEETAGIALPKAEEEIALLCLDFRGCFMDGWTLVHPDEVDWQEIEETVRWVAIQEPECGTCYIEPAWQE